MPAAIDGKKVRTFDHQSAQLVEVLPAEEYEEEHLPAQSSFPLKQFDSGRLDGLDRNRPVIVYCWDYQCDLGPKRRHGSRLSFREVYDYVAGKADWLAAGLPSEGTRPSPHTQVMSSASRRPAAW